jgi:hypothetical protein
MTTFKIEDMFQPGTFGIFDATTGEKVAHQHTLDMFANCNADFASAIENAHTMTEAEFDKRCQNGRLHAHVLRDNFELPVREYIFGKAPKPKLEKLLEKYIYLYNHSLECNRGYLTIGFCYALKYNEGNYADGVPIYPEIDRNINCNWSFEQLITEVKNKIK